MKWKLTALAAALALPGAAAAEPLSSVAVVEGHTVFVHLSPGGSDLAAIAGSVMCQVLWFNDQVLFRAPAGSTGLCGDARFVYAYPGNAPDPRGNPTLRPTGRTWDFADPNGAPWHVVEYEYKQLHVQVNQNLGLPNFVSENITIEQFNYTAWLVEVGPSVRDPTLNEDYNFVLLVDTGKVLLTERDATVHNGAGEPALGNSHGPSDPPHRHDRSWVTLALGDTPPLWS